MIRGFKTPLLPTVKQNKFLFKCDAAYRAHYNHTINIIKSISFQYKIEIHKINYTLYRLFGSEYSTNKEAILYKEKLIKINKEKRECEKISVKVAEFIKYGRASKENEKDIKNLRSELYNSFDPFFKYKRQGIFAYTNFKQITYSDFNEKFSWAKEVPAIIRRDAVKTCKDAMVKFLSGNGKNGRPQYQSKKKAQHFYSAQGNQFELRGLNNKATHIRFPNIGWIKLQRKDYIPLTTKNGNKVKMANVACEYKAGKWYCSITIYVDDPKEISLKNQTLGIDPGCRKLAVISDGKGYIKSYELRDAEKQSFEKLEKKLKQWQRIATRRFVKGIKIQSHNWYKAQDKVKFYYKKIDNLKIDIRHKITNNVKQHHVNKIILEDLNIAGMKKGKSSSSLQNQMAGGMFAVIRDLSYKSSTIGTEIRQVDRYYASSKICNCCGEKNEIGSKEKWICIKCNSKHDRDVNAAINLAKAIDKDTKIISRLDKKTSMYKIKRCQ